MVWSSVDWPGISNIEFIDGIMTKEVYLGILKKKLEDSVIKVGLAQRYIFQEDNAGIIK